MHVAPRSGVLLSLFALTLFTAGAQAGIFAAQVNSMADPKAVAETLLAKGAYELPVEALAAYEEGVRALDAGDAIRAKTAFTQATVLDPGFPEAHLALARIHLFSDPRESLEDVRRAGDAALSTFSSQHLLAVNGVFGVTLLLALGLFTYLAYLTLHGLSRVHHSLAEHLKLRFTAPISKALAFGLLLTPMFWGTGALVFLMVCAGVLWPWLRRGERAWAVVLGVPVLLAPLALWFLSPSIYAPLDPGGRTFLLSRAMVSPATPALVRSLEHAANESPDDPELSFALALVRERSGDYARAAADYEKALELGASESAVANNLGVIAFHQDDYDRAMESLQRSVASDPYQAASRFNLSQTYAKKLYFEKADQELAAANRLDIGRVRAALRRSDGDPKRVMIDVLFTPKELWRAASVSPRTMPTLPAWLTFLFPGSLWIFPVVAALGFVAGFLGGRRLHRTLPSFACANCGQSVCRRCLRRIRHEAYCASCGDALLRIQSASYSKLVLDARIRRKRRSSSVLVRITDWILPGLGAVRRGKSTVAVLIIFALVTAVLGFIRGGLPVTRLVWANDGPGPWWPEIPAVLFGFAFLVSAATTSFGRPAPRTAGKGYLTTAEGTGPAPRVGRAA